MFAKGEWDIYFGRKKSLRIMAICLFYQAITVKQVYELPISNSTREESEHIFMRRLVGKKYFYTERIQAENMKECYVYIMTPKGANYCVEELKKLLISNKESFPESITEECLDYLYHRFVNIPKKKNLKHTMEIYNMNIYLLSNPVMNRYYFEQETLINSIGMMVPLQDKLKYVNSPIKLIPN